MLTGYGTPRTKRSLFEAQQGKCAWCERRTDFSSAPVDHYRPKDGAWRNLPKEPLRVDEGYYWWLAWSWSNLLFSCVRCNDAGHKANYFPLRRERGAQLFHASLCGSLHGPAHRCEWRAPPVIGPCWPRGSARPHRVADNMDFDPSDWTWTPLGRTEEGSATIKILMLEELAEDVQQHVRTALLPSIKEMKAHIRAKRLAAARRLWNQLLKDNLAPGSTLTAFTWQALALLVPEDYRRKHGLQRPLKPGVSLPRFVDTPDESKHERMCPWNAGREGSSRPSSGPRRCGWSEKEPSHCSRLSGPLIGAAAGHP